MQPDPQDSQRAVPVYNCHALLKPRDEQGLIEARAAALPEVFAHGRSEREALAGLVAKFKQAIAAYTSAGADIPWANPPLTAQPGDQERWIAVHL
jgi:hypothetical protein